jgi:NTE family protein
MLAVVQTKKSWLPMRLLTRVQPRPVEKRKPVGLALQGGGSWGAYTWGVLDVVLSARTIAVAQLSGASAGAINAAIVAGALAKGSPARARASLAAFWRHLASPSLANDGLAALRAEQAWQHAMTLWLLSAGTLSPYQANPLGINPLRAAIEAHVDIDAIRSPSAPRLFVTVTHVKTGLPRVISNDEMTVDALLASACLPQLFQAVEIDGEPYWDGGYLGNPALAPMIHSGAAEDLLIVQLVPDGSDDAPRDALSIRRRLNEIVFNSSLMAEMQGIAAMRDVAERVRARMPQVRLHRIGPPQRELLLEGSALDHSRIWLERLREAGRTAAKRFMARHSGDVGIRETLDLATMFSERQSASPANEPEYDRSPG